MGCQGCRKRSIVNSRVAPESSGIEFPIVYVICRHCGALRAMRFNLATQFVKLECEECNHKMFHVLKQAPTPEVLKKLTAQSR